MLSKGQEFPVNPVCIVGGEAQADRQFAFGHGRKKKKGQRNAVSAIDETTKENEGLRN
jgi:hypothetical protein